VLKTEYIPLELFARRALRSDTLITVTVFAQSASNLQTWKLTLAYDGTDFRGWQVQPSEPTIQGELQAALGRVTGEAPLPQGSGRTDAGVHALAQVASFTLRAPIPPENLLRALNRTLPPSIRVLETRTVRSTFHARHLAVAKTYEYRIFQGDFCPPFLARYLYACPWPMDVEALQRSARLFVGEHDFLSFAATDPDLTSREASFSIEFNQKVKVPTAPPTAPLQDKLDPEGGGGFNPRIKPSKAIGALAPDGCSLSAEKGTIRTLFSSAWERRQSEAGEILVYRVRGNGFLHHMVRNLVGTMLEVGRGYLRSEDIPGILAARSRSAAGPTAPARGLFLCSVE
jgi:tRNA pseudouridine38-40 synthase